jgi:glycerophosphoryl diester phosphodiesterase
MKIVAHRGASGDFPENTLLAFEQAIVQCCDVIEFDIQYHPSGEFILLHDNHLMNEQHQMVNFNTLTLQKLTEYSLPQQQKIPTLKQAVTLINNRCLLNIEIKSNNLAIADISMMVESLLKQLNSLTNKNISGDKIILSSFNHHILAAIKTLAPHYKTAALIASCPLSYNQFATSLSVQSVNVSLESLNQNLVDDAHARGLELWVYTVNNEDDILICKNLGVDAIFTDFPKRSRTYLHSLATL